MSICYAAPSIIHVTADCESRRRDVGRSENMGGEGGHNLHIRVEIGFTDMPKWGGGGAHAPGPPGCDIPATED